MYQVEYLACKYSTPLTIGKLKQERVKLPSLEWLGCSQGMRLKSRNIESGSKKA